MGLGPEQRGQGWTKARAMGGEERAGGRGAQEAKVDGLWGCLGQGEVSRPRSRFGYEDSETRLGHVGCEAPGRPPGGQGNPLFSYLNCSLDDGLDAWESEMGRQEVQKLEEVRMGER